MFIFFSFFYYCLITLITSGDIDSTQEIKSREEPYANKSLSWWYGYVLMKIVNSIGNKVTRKKTAHWNRDAVASSCSAADFDNTFSMLSNFKGRCCRSSKWHEQAYPAGDLN